MLTTSTFTRSSVRMCRVLVSMLILLLGWSTCSSASSSFITSPFNNLLVSKSISSSSSSSLNSRMQLMDSSSSNSNSSSLCLSGATPLKLADSCALGFYCPWFNASDPATVPVQCAPTNDCIMDRISSKFCSPQGKYEPTLCPKGSYCPSPLNQIECPSGYVCVIGQFEPRACPTMSTCPAGSTKPVEYGSLIIIIIVDVGCAIAYFAARRWQVRQRALRDQEYGAVRLASVNASLYAKGMMYAQLPPHSKLLCQGFKRAQIEQRLPRFRIEFDQLSITIPAPTKKDKAKTILRGVTGSIEPAKVTAIMGPSGAGKTTFLTALLGSIDSTWTTGGSLKVNGTTERLARFRHIVGYVPQDDVMHRDLTVADNVAYSANVRLPRRWTKKQREDHINSTIMAMQLQHVQDVRVGDETTRGVSGGQRKRTNIAMEVAAAPLLLLLDEPTSGLDSTAAMDICRVLTDLARVSSITVAMVIHQPRREIFEALDELLLLAPGGVTVYQGPQRLVVPYFTQRLDVTFKAYDNPADTLMDEIATHSDLFVRMWKEGGPDYVHQLSRQEYAQPSPIVEVPSEEEQDDDDDIMMMAENQSYEDNQTEPALALVKGKINNLHPLAGAATNDTKDETRCDSLLVEPVGADGTVVAAPPSSSSSSSSSSASSASSTSSSVGGVGDQIGETVTVNSSNGETPGCIAAASKSGEMVTLHVRPASNSNVNVYGGSSIPNNSVVPSSSSSSSAAATDENGVPISNPTFVRTVSELNATKAFAAHGLRQHVTFPHQVWLALKRSLWKQVAALTSLFLEVGLGMFAGGFMGALITLQYQGVLKQPYTILSPTPLEQLIPQLCFNIGLSVSLAAASAGVAVFGEEIPIYRREVAAGHSHVAYYVGVTLAQAPRVFLDAVHFSFIFHILSNPLISFSQLFPLIFMLYFAIYGLAAIMSMVVSRKNAPLLSVVFSLIVCSMTNKGGIPDPIQYLSASRWMAEAIYNVETEVYIHIMDVDGSVDRLGFTRGRFGVDVTLMFTMCVLYRLIAYAAMMWADRKLLSKK